MAHGTPDWGVTAGAVTTYQLTELAELAARLGSIVTFDRRGDVIFLEDFEDGLNKWTPTPYGKDAAAGLSAAYARSGRYSARLVPGSDGSRLTTLLHYHSKPVASGLGVEFSWTRPPYIEKVELYADVYDGATLHNAWVRYVTSTRTLEIYARGIGWQAVLTGVVPISNLGAFHTLKLVFNTETDAWVRLLYNDQAVDLSPYSLVTGTDYIDPGIQLNPRVIGEAGYNQPVYVDDVILTQNEPA